MKLIIPGKPIAKKRPRFVRRGKFVGTYNDQETEEGKFLFDVRQQTGGQGVIYAQNQAISLNAVFHMPIPKSVSKKRYQAMLDGIEAHTKKPDLDNLVKFTKDCLNGEVWHDDSQVVELRARKIYSDNPRTEVEICAKT